MISYIAHEDQEAITPSNFLSQVGGALNLWAGINIIIVVNY